MPISVATNPPLTTSAHMGPRFDEHDALPVPGRRDGRHHTGRRAAIDDDVVGCFGGLFFGLGRAGDRRCNQGREDKSRESRAGDVLVGIVTA